MIKKKNSVIFLSKIIYFIFCRGVFLIVVLDEYGEVWWVLVKFKWVKFS